jgi:AraC-like DNA-binding protein
MTLSGSIYDFFLYAMVGLYFVALVRLAANWHLLKEARWLAIASACWPVFMLDEWVRLADASALTWSLGATDVFGVALLSCCYRFIKSMLILVPSKRSRLFWPVGVTAVFQLSILLMPLHEKSQWLVGSPVGEPLLLWPAYIPSLVAAFSILLIGILVTEHIQLYHRYLPYQVVDVGEYKIPRLAGLLGSTVGVSFLNILLVTAAMFGFFTIPFWESLYHVLIGAVLLVVLLTLTSPRNTSPSPLEYDRFDKGEETPANIRRVLQQAELAVINTKAYKDMGLTLKQFCLSNEIDPTLLAIALQLERKQTFRSFIYKYRLDYAKNVLLNSDAKVARVAKRLGLNSEKFLSDFLVKHLRRGSK